MTRDADAKVGIPSWALAFRAALVFAAIYVGVLLLALLSLLFDTGSVPTQAELRRLFHEHRGTFEALHEFAADRTAGSELYPLPEQRRHVFEELRRIGASGLNRYEGSDGVVETDIRVAELWLHAGISIVHRETPPAGLVETLEDVGPQEDCTSLYVELAPGWYIKRTY